MLLAYAGDDKKMVAAPPSSNQRGGRGGGGAPKVRIINRGFALMLLPLEKYLKSLSMHFLGGTCSSKFRRSSEEF
jgi:hypothetical protein